MPRRLRSDESGFAMMSVIMGLTSIVFLIVLIFQASAREYNGAQNQRRDDTIVVGAEAMLERYAAKLTIDPLYYRNYVDEAELPRTCTDSSSSGYGLTVQPGNPWHTDCQTWDYGAAPDFFEHPLLAGNPDITADDVAALLTVSPPVGGDLGVEINVVAQQEEFGQLRSISAEIRPESISEFAFLVQGDLRFGSGAVIDGKIYVGDDLDFRLSPVQGVVHRDVYAEDKIGHYSSSYGPPVFLSGSQGYDGYGEYEDIRDVYPEPLDFTKFWDDLTLIRDVACEGGGLCLSRSLNPSLGLSQDPTAWLIEPIVSGNVGRLKVSAAYSNNSYSCVNSEEWWWINSHNASWSTVGTFDIPLSGAVWADGHVVMGKGTTGTVKGAVTVYAGSIGSRKNVIIGSDLVYHSGTTGTDVLGLIASDEVWVNPASVGSDDELNINAAMLTQDGSFQVGRTCGSSGSVMLPYSGGQPISELTTNGSMAILHTGDVAAHFSPRNYGFDQRLESLRPPLFPLLQDSWFYANWREEGLPCWALPAGC